MPHDSSTDAPASSVTLETITISDPMTGLPCTVLRAAYEHSLRSGEPIIIRLLPHLERGRTRPPERNEDDEIIGEIIADNPGLTRIEIEEHAAKHYRRLGAGTFTRRMAKGMPLAVEGYHSIGRGKATRYFPPAN